MTRLVNLRDSIFYNSFSQVIISHEGQFDRVISENDVQYLIVKEWLCAWFLA